MSKKTSPAIKKFLARLRKFAGPKTFKIKPDGYIRSIKGEYCPIAYVAKRIGIEIIHPEQYFGPGSKMGLSPQEKETIIGAADNCCNSPQRRGFRGALIQACKIKTASPK